MGEFCDKIIIGQNNIEFYNNSVSAPGRKNTTKCTQNHGIGLILVIKDKKINLTI